MRSLLLSTLLVACGAPPASQTPRADDAVIDAETGEAITFDAMFGRLASARVVEAMLTFSERLVHRLLGAERPADEVDPPSRDEEDAAAE